MAFQSQVWRGSPWNHELYINTPAQLARRDVVVIFLTGGSGGENQLRAAARLASQASLRTAVLTRVPNQPLYNGRREDDLLSFSLDQYRRSGDASWPLLFPMVASVVRGIDTLEHVLDEKRVSVVLIGASKRGWTTYLTAAVDQRVVAMVPTVFEMVAMQAQIALMRERYGHDSEKIRPYTALGLTNSLTEPRVAQLVQWLDPVHYFRRYTIPKLVLLGANDPYWVVDSVRQYWEHLPEPKLLRMLPNVGHGVLAEDAAQHAITSFIRAVFAQPEQPVPYTTPHYRWRYSGPADGVALLTGESTDPLTQCVVWRATAPTPDFRTAQFLPHECRILPDTRSFTSKFSVEPAQSTAVFAELTFTSQSGEAVVVSTEPQVYQR